MNDNPYAPYPRWFERYGNHLEKMPDKYLRSMCLLAMETYDKNKNKIMIHCEYCNANYMSEKSDGPCPFCKAPRGYDASKAMRWWMA